MQGDAEKYKGNFKLPWLKLKNNEAKKKTNVEINESELLPEFSKDIASLGRMVINLKSLGADHFAINDFI